MATKAVDPVASPQAPNIWNQFVDTVEKDSIWLFGKSCNVIYTGLEWKKTLGSVSPAEVNVGTAAKVVKCAIGAAELPKSTVELGKSVRTFIKEPSLSNLKTAFISACKIGSPLNDIVDVAKKFSILPEPIAKVWGAVGPVLMFFGLGDMAVNKCGDLASDMANIADSKLYQAKTVTEIKERTKVVDQALCRIVKTVADLAMAVSYVALAVILFTTFVGLLTVTPWIPLALSTIALAAILFSKFYGKLVVERMPRDAQKVPANSLIRNIPAAPASAVNVPAGV